MSPTTKSRIAGSMFLLLFGLSASAPGQTAPAEDKIFVRPLNGSVVLRFGQRYTDVASGKIRAHCGSDIAASPGSRVTASASGRVSFAGHTPLGNCVSIKHENGVKTTYLPLEKITVSSGDSVQRGQTIGYVSAAGDGSSSGSHLHAGAIFGGKYINPETLWRGEFRADFSRLIRRADIPPAGVSIASTGNSLAGADPLSINAGSRASVLTWLAGLWQDARGFVSGLWQSGEAFLARLIDIGAGAFQWSKSLWKSSFTFFGQHVFVAGKSQAFWPAVRGISRPGFGRLLGSLTPAVAVYRLDPSGDAAFPVDRLTISLDSDNPVRELEVFNRDGDRIRVVESWESRAREISWTGEDDSGRIVPDGLYTIIVRRTNGSVAGCVAEVIWHS